jgi:hypothetical protein
MITSEDTHFAIIKELQAEAKARGHVELEVYPSHDPPHISEKSPRTWNLSGEVPNSDRRIKVNQCYLISLHESLLSIQIGLNYEDLPYDDPKLIERIWHHIAEYKGE